MALYAKGGQNVDGGRKLMAKQTVNLQMLAPGCKLWYLGCGWPELPGHDLDFGMAVVDKDMNLLGKPITFLRDGPYNFHFYPDETNPAISRTKDVTGGEEKGDDERAFIDTGLLEQLVPEAARIIVILHIYQAFARHQTFASFTGDTYVRLDNGETGEPLVRSELDDEFGPNRAIILGSWIRTPMGWQFEATKQVIDPPAVLDDQGASQDAICYLFREAGVKGWENIDPTH